MRKAVLPSQALNSIAGVGCVLAAISAWGGAATATSSRSNRSNLIEMEVRDVIPLQEVESNAVLLISKDGQLILPIFIDGSSAVSIAFRLAHRATPRVLPTDLMEEMLSELGGRVTEIRIEKIEDDVYLSRLYIRQGRRRVVLRARASDSIAMALAAGAKIYAARRVCNEAGISRKQLEDLKADRDSDAQGIPASKMDPVISL